MLLFRLPHIKPTVAAIIAFTIISSCGREKGDSIKRFEELIQTLESRREKEKEQERLDSITHLRIQDSLRSEESNRILGNIYFGMSKRDYENARNKLLKECGGYLTIDDCKFEFSNGYFDLGQLYGVKLLSNCEKINWTRICNMFKEKYGPPTFPGAPGGTFPISARYHKYWIFDFKRIDVRFDSGAHGNDFYNHGTVYIEIYDPHILDRIQERKQKKEEEKAQKEESNKKTSDQYTKQL